MRYIATIGKTSFTNTIKVYLNKQSKTFTLKIKETGVSLIYNLYDSCFEDYKVHATLFEQALIHAYFYHNGEELHKIANSIEDNNLDFISHNLTLPNVDYSNARFIYDLNKIYRD